MKNYYKYFKVLLNSEIIGSNKLRFIIQLLIVNFKFRILKVNTFKWVDNLTLSLERGDSGLLNNLYLGFAELELLFVLKYANNNHTFVDVGANSGEYSILLSGIRKIKSYSFEPSTLAYSRLRENVVKNNLEEYIFTNKLALGSERKGGYLTNNHDLMNFVSNDGGAHLEQIQIETLDNCLSDINLKSKLIMKIDVEGYELEVLKGANNILKSGQIEMLVIETNDSGLNFGSSDLEIARFLSTYGFQPFRLLYLKNVFSFSEGINSGGNTIFVKDKSSLINVGFDDTSNFCFPLNRCV